MIRDALGFIDQRCPDCGAQMFVSADEALKPAPRAICLNACALSVGAYRRMQEGLRQAALRVQARECSDQK